MCEFLRIVGKNAEIGHLDTIMREQSGEQKAIGVVERRARQSRPGFDNLVAGRKQRHAHAAAHIKLGETERRGERNVLRG